LRLQRALPQKANSNSKPVWSRARTPVPGAKGEVKYEAEFLSDGVTVKEAEFKAKVQIPIPNNVGIDATNAATPGIITLDLTRLNQSTQLNESYATCTMALKKVVGKQNGTKAMYALKVQAKLKNGQYQPGKKQLGSCDIDLITADIQSGVPAVQPGDTAYVVVNSNTDILTAVFGSEDDEEDDD
jgi:hypothetical protein